MRFPRIVNVYRDKLKNLWAKTPIIDDVTISSGTLEYTFSIDQVERKNISIDAIKQIIFNNPWSAVAKPPHVTFESTDTRTSIIIRFIVLGETQGKIIEENIKKSIKNDASD
ncbi:hypothetical protein FNH22_05685 [Fulvivirga sp. M361]|uniref:hypothetical protein n=1 Tax=Fulvivirga sp. M361 TaxID=2594266 RepID=UPI00117BB2DB|nr:hypothetical protein [Fulvivirga sp. M361]TRX60541.1 hypothetical protein FNH22_05685 [Fulvivirga sp. M361]